MKKFLVSGGKSLLVVLMVGFIFLVGFGLAKLILFVSAYIGYPVPDVVAYVIGVLFVIIWFIVIATENL